MGNYKGIEFRKEYNLSFADFKKEFESTFIFKNIHPKKRTKELMNAYKIATKGNLDFKKNVKRISVSKDSKKYNKKKDND